MKNWFLIKAQQNADSAEISIHDYIGTWNINAKMFLDQLRNVNSKNITLTMNSLGGSVIDGIAIYNGLREHAKKTNATITVKVLGMVASISSIIAMAGDKIIMPKNTFMMVHSPMSGLQGNASEFREMADLLDKFESSLIQTYVARTGKTAEDIKAMLDKETFMTADEALAMGFADEVTEPVEIIANFELENLPENILAVYKSAKNSTENPTKDQNVDPKAVDPKNEQSDETLSSKIITMAADMGLTDFVDSFLLNTNIMTDVQARGAMIVASEIKDLCLYAKMPDITAELIANKSSLNEARAEICKRKADVTDKANIDNKIPNQNVPPSNEKQAVINHAEIYASRKPKRKEK